MKKYQKCGFTLIELLIALVIFAIVAAIAVPSFVSMIEGNRQTSTINNFIGMLQVARGEAIKRNVSVSLCKSDNGSSCATGTNWEGGWIVFVDADPSNTAIEDIDNDGAITKGVELLKVHEGIGSDAVFQSTVNIVSYSRKGRASSSLTFTYCDAKGGNDPKAIIIRESGRQSASEIAHDGSALSCPS